MWLRSYFWTCFAADLWQGRIMFWCGELWKSWWRGGSLSPAPRSLQGSSKECGVGAEITVFSPSPFQRLLTHVCLIFFANRDAVQKAIITNLIPSFSALLNSIKNSMLGLLRQQLLFLHHLCCECIWNLIFNNIFPRERQLHFLSQTELMGRKLQSCQMSHSCVAGGTSWILRVVPSRGILRKKKWIWDRRNGRGCWVTGVPHHTDGTVAGKIKQKKKEKKTLRQSSA